MNHLKRKRDFISLLSQQNNPVTLAIGYGSGIKKQVDSRSKESVSDNYHSSKFNFVNNLRNPVMDLIFLVDEYRAFHKQNIETNPGHYKCTDSTVCSCNSRDRSTQRVLRLDSFGIVPFVLLPRKTGRVPLQVRRHFRERFQPRPPEPRHSDSTGQNAQARDRVQFRPKDRIRHFEYVHKRGGRIFWPKRREFRSF